MKAAGLLALVLVSACLMPPPQSGSGPTYASSSPSTSSDGTQPAMTGSTGSTPAAATAEAPAGPVYVTIRSACSKTVKVFYGEKPGFGSGTLSSIDSNSVQSHSFRQGEMFWIVDESEHGISSTSISANTRELEIGSSCTSINAR